MGVTRDGDARLVPRDTGAHDIQEPEVSTSSRDTTSVMESPDYLVLGLAVGAALVGFILLIVLLLCIIKYRSNRKTLAEFQFDDVTTLTSKSEPNTRSSSPSRHSSKRGSSLLSQGGGTNKKAAILMRSLTVDMIPDFELPPERVQPPSDGERRHGGHQTALQFQHSLLSSLSVDMPGLANDPDDGDSVPSPSGRIWFSLIYDAAVDELAVNLIKSKQLKPREKGNSPRDPFVKLYLLPDERTCQESRVKKKTLSPKFNETFTFKVTSDDIASRTLRMSVYDVDKRRVRHSLGHVILPLTDVDLTRGDVMWRDLEQLSQNSGSLGELNLNLCYTPTSDKLKVVVLRAKNLKKLEYGQDTGVYVRVQLMHGQKIHKTKRTDAQCGTCEPSYNESFPFNVPTREIDCCSVVATVMVNAVGRLGNHEEEYGKVIVGPFLYARGEELMHWQDMLSQPRNAVTRWHQLIPCQKQQTE